MAILSWTAGASPSTSIIRGGVTFLAFGFIGWGINAILVAAGQNEAEEDDTDDENALPDIEDTSREEEMSAEPPA